MINLDKNKPETVVLSDSAIGHLDEDESNPYLFKIPFTITNHSSNREWLDTPDMNPDDEIDLLEDLKTPGLLGTAQPNENAYITAYEKIFSAGTKRIVVIPMSQALSGSYNSAVTAAEKINQGFNDGQLGVFVANSLTVSIPQRLQVEKAIETIKLMETQNKSEQSVEKVIAEIENIRSKIHVAELFPSLQHIVMGGRGSEAIKKIFGGRAAKTLEKIGFNALLGLSLEGKLEPIIFNPLKLKGREKVKRQAIQSIVQRIGCDAIKLSIVKFGVGEAELDTFQSNCIDAIEEKGTRIINAVPRLEQSRTLNIHSGYRALGVVAYEQY